MRHGNRRADHRGRVVRDHVGEHRQQEHQRGEDRGGAAARGRRQKTLVTNSVPRSPRARGRAPGLPPPRSKRWADRADGGAQIQTACQQQQRQPQRGADGNWHQPVRPARPRRSESPAPAVPFRFSARHRWRPAPETLCSSSARRSARAAPAPAGCRRLQNDLLDVLARPPDVFARPVQRQHCQLVASQETGKFEVGAIQR